MNPVLATAGRGQVLHRLYSKLIDLRSTVPALGCRGLSPPEITVDPGGQMLDLRRRESGSCVRLLFHLGEVKGYYQTTWPAGPWHNILDSADVCWDGPGATLPDMIPAGETPTLVVPPRSCAAYTLIA